MQKYTTLLVLLFLCLNQFTNAQIFEWARSMGGADLQEGHAIAVDDDKNVYTTGYFRGTTDFDPGAGVFNLTSAGNNDVFISKLDASGNFVWAKQFGGIGFDECYSIQIDPNGNIYTIGRFEGTADFDPGAGVFNLTSAGSFDVFISKLDASGSFVWAKQYAGSSAAEGFRISVDAIGSVYATGRFQGTVDFDPGPGVTSLSSAGVFDAFITKLDSFGDFVWAKRLGGANSEEGYSIALDNSGNILTTGVFDGTVDFDPGAGVFNLSSIGFSDIFILKLDSFGDFIWAKTMGGAGIDIARSIAIDNNGNILTTGSFTNTADFDPGPGVSNLSSSGNYDVFISKLDSFGNFIWANKIGGTAAIHGFSIAADPSGNVYTTGDFNGSVGAGSFGYSSNGLSDIFISRLDATGNFDWLQRIGGGSTDKGYAIAVDEDLSVYTTGYFRLGADFNPGSGTFNLSSAGAEDIFVHKMSQCINTASTDNQIACYEYTWPLNFVTYYASTNTPTVTLVNAAGCDSVVTLNLTILSQPVPTGDASQSFCNSATVADLSATGIGIQWYATNLFGATPLSPETVLSNGATYYASQTGTNCEGALLAVTVTINTTAAPTGSAGQEFCDNATVGDLSATGTNIQWYNVATGGTALSAGTALTNGATYYASQTVNGCESTSRLAVMVTITSTTAPTGSTAQTVCSGATIANLSVTGTNILWYSAATGGSPLAIGTTLVDGTTYYASQTVNGCESVTRLAVNVVFGIPAAPTGTASQTFCNSATIAELSATGTAIQWYAASTGGTALSAGSALMNGTTYYASQTSGGCESTDRLAVTVTINAPAAPTGTATQEFCNAATVADLTATGSGIQWYATPSGGTALSSGTALSNGTYYASQTISGCESINRLAVTVTINAPAAPTGTVSQTFCGPATLADIIVTGSGIQWYAAASGGTALSAGTALVSGNTYYASQTVSGCESINRLAVSVAVNPIPAAPTGTASQTFCNSATIADLSATGTTIQWYATASGGTALSAGTALVNGSTYYASQTASGCESTDRFAVTVTINAPAAPTGTATQEFCNAATVADLTATGSGIQWYTSPSGGTALASGTALSNATFYASQTVSGCESINRLAVTVTINTPAAPTGAANQAFCGSATLDDLSVSGTNITWYDAPSAGNVLAGSTAAADGSTYYASQTISGCESVNRLSVTVTINATPAAPTATATQEFCNGATVVDLTATGSGIQWYTSATGGTALSAGTALTTGSYFASQTVNGCESTDRVEVGVTIITPATPTGDAAQNFCSASTVADLTATGMAIQWYTQAAGGTALAAGTALSNGTYYASQTINGCESQRLEVTVTVTVLNNTVTENGLTLTANQTGAAYTWVDCNNGNQPIPGATAQSYTATANGSYAVIVEQNGCSVTSNCVAITTVGLDDLKAGLFRVYPNPTSTVIHIELEKATGIRLMDVTGKLILEENGATVYTIDVTHLTTGLYIIETAEGAKAKFVKQ